MREYECADFQYHPVAFSEILCPPLPMYHLKLSLCLHVCLGTCVFMTLRVYVCQCVSVYINVCLSVWLPTSHLSTSIYQSPMDRSLITGREEVASEVLPLQNKCVCVGGGGGGSCSHAEGLWGGVQKVLR